MTNPISPKDIDDFSYQHRLQIAKEIPAKVIQCFNDLIVKNYENGYSRVQQKDVVENICKVMNTDKNKIFDNKWLDIEILFENVGWKCVYEKGAYYDESDPFWTFKK